MSNQLAKCRDKCPFSQQKYYYNVTFDRISIVNAKQKHLGCKKVQGQSEAILLTGMCDQKL